uniref:PGG domain-containing protein n=1 Tax=Fagus sylvatica TaxID=28930 RepID=A0A2N9IFB1_FAGSY
MLRLKPSFARKPIPNGLSPIHLALQNGQYKMVDWLVHVDNNLAVSHLLFWGGVDINFKNLEGKTAWDILEGQTQVDNTEMRVMLRRAGASTGSSLSTVTTYEDYLRRPKFRFLRDSITSHAREVANFSDGKRNALLVIAALFVTVTYQAVLSPPGGLWQDDYKPETNQTLCNTTAPLKAGSSHLGINQTHCNTTAPHKAGTAIGLGGMPFRLFLMFNFVVFMISITVLALLIHSGALIPCSGHSFSTSGFAILIQ